MILDIRTEYIDFSTLGHTHIVDITDKVEHVLKNSGFTEGNMTIFGIGSTTGISTIEFEPGLVNTDLPAVLQKYFPYEEAYAHNNTWGDDNGAAHLRSTLIGSSLNVPFINSTLILGTWQQIIFIDFDTRPRNRKVVVQMIGK